MAQQLTPQDLQQYIDEYDIQARLIPDIGDTPTVPTAAAALGVTPEQIVKTLLFLVQLPDQSDGEPLAVVVISNGESRVDRKPLSAHFGVGRKRIKLAPAAIVLDIGAMWLIRYHRFFAWQLYFAGLVLAISFVIMFCLIQVDAWKR